MINLNAWQPDMVLNRLNARQSENFTEFSLKPSFKLTIKCFFSNVKRSTKLFSFFVWRNIRAWAYYKMAISWHFKQFGANRILNIHLTNSDWKPHINLLKVFDISLEMLGHPKNYFGYAFDEFTELDCRACSLFKTVTGSLISHWRYWAMWCYTRAQ